MPQDNIKNQQTNKITGPYKAKACSQQFYKMSPAQQASEQLDTLRLAELENFKKLSQKVHRIPSYKTKEFNFPLKLYQYRNSYQLFPISDKEAMQMRGKKNTSTASLKFSRQ